MNYNNISLEQMNKLGKEILSKQSAVTLEEAKAQVLRLKQQSSQNTRNKNLNCLGCK